jgi:PAS domain S-box-containing protein
VSAISFDAVLRKIRIAFIAAALAVAVFGVASYVTISRLVEFAETAVGTQDKLILLEQLNSSLSRTQAALREYIMTGKAIDLERFQARAWEQKNAAETLGEPPTLPEQQDLERLISERTQLQYEFAAARTRGDQAAAMRLMESIRSQEADAELAEMLKTIRTREQHGWWNSHAVPVTAWARQTVLAAGLLLIAMFGWMFWIVRRYEGERMRVTTLLDESEAMSRALAANMADGLVTLSENLTVLSMNAAALEMLDYTQEEVTGWPIAELMANYPGREEFQKRLTARLLDPTPFKIVGLDMLVLRKDGRRLPVQVSLNDVNVGGRRLLTALVRDMSSIVEATEAAQASERHLREITNTLPVLMIELDTEHRCTFLNRACAEFFAIPAEQAIGRSLLELHGPELHAVHLPHLEQALRGSSVRYEVTAANAHGESGTYDMHLIPRFASGTGELVGCYAFATDITMLKRIDRMKTEFISTVSHELRTPLTSIRGSLGLMSGGIAGKLSDAAANLVGIAQTNCDRLIRLINDILDSEKIESGKLPLRLQPLDATALVQQAVSGIEGFAGQHGVTVQVTAPADAATVRADVDRLLQVLTNLLSNAVKFSPAQGVVQVRVSTPGQRVRVEVADQGPGIPVEFQQRIFQKFSQADSSDTRAKGGTGLGLNISRTLVEKMDGRIGFSSTPGAGATFFFELPLHDAVAPAETPAVPRRPAPADARRRQILHVEGDGDIRAIVSDLASGFATCVSAGSLQDARDRLRESDFDLVLLEPELEDGSGWDLLGELEARNTVPPVIVFSASGAEPPPGRRVAAVLVKSHTTEARLVQAMRRTIEGFAETMPAPLTFERVE